MSIKFDAFNLSATFTSGGSISWSHTVAPGIFPILIIGQSIRTSGGSPTPASAVGATFNSVSATQIGLNNSGSDGIWLALHYLLSPPTGSSYTVQSTWAGHTGNAHGRCFSISFHGVDYGSPLVGSWTSVAHGSTSAPSISVPSLLGGVVVDILSRVETFGGGSSIDSAGSGQTEIMRGGVQNNIKQGYAASYETPVSFSTTMNWNTTTARITNQAGICLRPAPVSQGVAVSPFYSF